MRVMEHDLTTNWTLPPGCGVLTGIHRFRPTDGGEEVLRMTPNFLTTVWPIKEALGLSHDWLVSPDDPRDHPFAGPEDEKFGIVVFGPDGAVRGFLRKAGVALGFAWAIARWRESPNLSLISMTRRGPPPLDLGDARKVPLLRAMGHALKMHPVLPEPIGWGEVPDLRTLVIRDQLTFLSGIGFEARRRERQAREEEDVRGS